jgi:hypothetical protein
VKKILNFLAVLVCLASCKKDKEVINPDDVRIIKTKSVGPNNDVTYGSFDYDQQGRITKYSGYTNTQPPTAYQEISYSGNNEVIIKEPGVNNSSLISTAETRYIINAQNRPLKKIHTEVLEFFAPANIPQKTFINDTTVYEFDGAGLLLKTTRSRRDSIRSQSSPVNWQVNIDLTSSVANYTNTSGNVTKIITRENIVNRVYNSISGLSSKQTVDEEIIYAYDKNYVNKTDFKNALILTELNIPYIEYYPLNALYKNAPNKIAITTVRKDENGNPISSGSVATNYLAGFNGYGFLSSFNTSPASPFNIELIYNK